MTGNEPKEYFFKEGDYVVSDRKLKEHKYAFNLTKDEINKIPFGGKVLNVGSGTHRTFETELAKERPDLLIVSIDPSLGIVTIDSEGKPTNQGYEVIDLHQGMYTIYRPNEPKNETRSETQYKERKTFRGEEAIQFDKKRKKLLTSIPGAIAATATTMPLSNDSVDIIFDLWGPIHYLNKIEDKQKYLEEIKRVMKVGAKAYVSFLDDDEKTILDRLGLKYTSIENDEEESWFITK